MDRDVALLPIRTIVSARTISVDPKTGRLFVAGAPTWIPAQHPMGARTQTGSASIDDPYASSLKRDLPRAGSMPGLPLL